MEMQEKSNRDQLIPMDNGQRANSENGQGERQKNGTGPEDWVGSLERLMGNFRCLR